MGLSYLLCRLLDTIEDAKWDSFSEQKHAFLEFDEFLRGEEPLSHQRLETWIRKFPRDLVEGERYLLNDADRLFLDFMKWPDEVRRPTMRLIRSMGAGMTHFMNRKSQVGRLALRDIQEVNQYCFFVAGLVGEMLGHLHSRVSFSHKKMIDAFRFGLFLQKINLLKDQREDEREGRFLVPTRAGVMASLRHDAEGAFRFLISIPEKEKDFRLFCAWSLFLGLASLPWIQQSAVEDGLQKIPREVARLCLDAVEERIADDHHLGKLFDEMTEPLFVGLPRVGLSFSGSGDERALLTLYEGSLPQDEVIALFRTVV